MGGVQADRFGGRAGIVYMIPEHFAGTEGIVETGRGTDEVGEDRITNEGEVTGRV